MSAKGTKRSDIVMVSWVSVNHGAAPLLTAIEGDTPYRGRIRRLYLCWRDVAGADGERERGAVRDTLAELHRRLDPSCPEIVKLPWKTADAPTNHAAIRPFAESALKQARDDNQDAPIVVHLSPGTPAMHAVWLILGSTGFVEGPISFIQTADERGRAANRSAVQEVRFDLDTWLRRYRSMRPRAAGDDDGRMWDPARVRSPRLRDALERLVEWAPLRVPVLLVGERGTGKTTLANFLRSMSPFQKDQPGGWPLVVCGQFRVNPELARSELFGHVKGSFTGATRDRPGLLEQADGDTLFFDEIADIDRDTQRLLMAAVEGRGFQRLGETRVRRSQFRLVCATNHPLPELRGTLLDQDFFDRIAVFILHVPPLRQCVDDLPDAWRRVLSGATRSAGVAPDSWERFIDHEELMAALARHPLPGNFRDLQRAAFHLLAALHAGRSEAEVVDVAMAALGPRDGASRAIPAADDLQRMLPLEGDLRGQLEAYERQWLRAAMASAGGNKSEASRLVGLPRKTFEHRWRNLTGEK